LDDLLYQYCVAYLDSRPASNDQVIGKCSQLYLIDGQKIPFVEALTSLAKRDAVADPGVLERSDAKGQDSIHFQQLRAYTLARQIIDGMASAGRTKVRVAVVGGGFAGLTAVSTLLREGGNDLHVTLFEHHSEVMPRFSGAFGRQVHPYHHLREPADPTIDAEGRVSWSCPVKGGGQLEKGGVEGILDWTPGPVERILDEVSKQVEQTFDAYRAAGRLELRLQQKVFGIDPFETTRCTLRAVNYLDVGLDPNQDEEKLETSSDQDNENSPREVFDVVIVAPGGQRDTVSVPGQSNAEYWQPSRPLNARPFRGRYEVAIIGGGNTAASEVFNYLLPKHDFVALIATLQKWATTHAALRQVIDHPFTTPEPEEAFGELATKQHWAEIKTMVDRELIAKGVIRSPNLLGVTLFPRSSEPLFEEMNPINRFLVLLFAKLGLLEIRYLYNDKTLNLDPKLKPWQTYAITIEDRRLVMKVGGAGTEIKPSQGGRWGAISNCSGATRSYHEVFSDSADEATEVTFGYQILGSAQTQWSLGDLLLAKQSLTREDAQGNHATVPAAG